MVEHHADKVTPKVHFVTHYPKSIVKHGPPIKNWCMRFEGKHRYFKQLAVRSLNFKNPLLTLTKRHQLRQAFVLSNAVFSMPRDEPSKLKTREIGQMSILVRRLLDGYVNETLLECATLTHQNVIFHKGSIFIERLTNAEEIPVFVRIRHLLKWNEKWLAIVEHLRTVAFDETLFAYEIDSTEKLSKMDLDDCIHFLSHGLDIYTIGQLSYVNVLARVTVH
jgi:hypothetical protein